ncbi:hypothetical protein DFH09DRAFT_1088908 [Mycena vulgaris]|nr:hypothetical protein DFH09DRAFT_1088908 [Mycena vulgaris]
MPTFAAAALGSLCSMRWEPSVIVSAEAVSVKVCWRGHVMPARVPATPNVDSLWAGGLRNPAITDGDLPDSAAQVEIERSLNSFRQTDRGNFMFRDVDCISRSDSTHIISKDQDDPHEEEAPRLSSRAMSTNSFLRQNKN